MVEPPVYVMVASATPALPLIALPGQDMSFAMTVCAARPNRVYTLLESPVIGKMESGANGDVVWRCGNAGIPTGAVPDSSLLGAPPALAAVAGARVKAIPSCVVSLFWCWLLYCRLVRPTGTIS